ncbi:MAG: ATP-dependent DNA helicase UvrD2 [Propionibacteriaceae bacterium]|jgi:superfamily I DNA/RNA helicase|nr:ATP-dependent DNA helicase UvrD2 [Propionibacteriaceae bacterium]
MGRGADGLLAGLDAAQRKVATTFDVPVAVMAGAGTGKTRAITYRIAHGSLIGAYDPAAVLAVTFTTRAAGELRERLAALGVPQVCARTFHSAALRQVQYFWPRAFGVELPRVSSDSTAIVAEACRRLGLEATDATVRDLVQEVSWAKVSNVSPGDYAEAAARAGRRTHGLDEAWTGRVLGRYEQVKNEAGVIDLDDILLCACALLAEQPQVAEEVRRTYRHLVVDEYQDVSPLQHTLLELWRGDHSDVCVVGDPAQTIHSFAGADAGYLLGFADRHPDAEVVRLDQDYRSTPQIVALANDVSKRLRLPGVRLRSRRPDGALPEVKSLPTPEGEAAQVAEWLAARHEAGLPWSHMAVLYRIHAQSQALVEALQAGGVPHAVKRAESAGSASGAVAGRDAVTLATIHAAKGLEWEAVAVVGAQEGTLPLSLAVTPEQVAEEARLFYVAVTRARANLLITWSRGGPAGERERSRFLPPLDPSNTPLPPAGQAPPAEPARTLQSRRCNRCGQSLTRPAELILGHHKGCPGDFDQAVFDALFDWRMAAAHGEHLPEFVILTEAALLALAEAKPTTMPEVASVIGARKAAKYGQAVLHVIGVETGRGG